MRSRLTDRLRATSLRTRLTAWNTAVVLFMLAATLVAVRVAARATLYADADAELRAASREVALAVRDLHPNADAIVAELRRKAASHEERGWFLHLLTEDGTSVWRSDHCPDVIAAFPPARLDRDENVVQVGSFRYVRRRIPRADAPAYHVRVGTSMSSLDGSLDRLLTILTAVGGILAILTPLAGSWLAARATRPIAAILQTAERLRPTRLGDRLLVRGTEDELDRLSRTINGLLDAVATHVDRQEQFVADAAHELRGPLAALQSSLEVAMTIDGMSPRQEEMLSDILEAARHLSRVTNDLLLLAESGSGQPGRVGVADVTAIVRQAANMFAGAAEEKGISLVVSGQPAAAWGDATQIRRLASNLLDNAIRFTPSGGRVDVSVTTGPSGPGERQAVLTVADTGVGIAPHHLAHVFDRFFKADAARSHSGTGRSGGLGLAICKSIAEGSGGAIGIASQPGQGTTITVRLPSPAPDTRAAQPAHAPQLTAPPGKLTH